MPTTRQPTSSPTTPEPTHAPIATVPPSTASPTTLEPTTSSPTAGNDPNSGASGSKDTGTCNGEQVEIDGGSSIMQLTSYAFGALGLLVGLLGFGTVVAFRERPAIRMSQRMLLALFSLGVALLNASVIPRVLSLSSPSQTDCLTHTFMFYLSLTFILACLCAKEWRAWIVFERTKKFKQVKVSNFELFVVIGAVEAVMLIILIVWAVMYPPSPDPCSDYRCASSSSVFAYVAFAYVLVLTIMTVIVAVLARNLNPVAGESTGILFTVSFVCFALVFLGILFATQSTRAYVETWLLSFSVSATSIVAMVLIVFRKLSWIHHSEAQIREQFLSGNFGSSAASMGGSSRNGFGPAETTHSASRESFAYSSSQAARPVFSNPDGLPKPEPLYNPFGRYGSRFSDGGYHDETTSATGLSDEISGPRVSQNEGAVQFRLPSALGSVASSRNTEDASYVAFPPPPLSQSSSRSLQFSEPPRAPRPSTPPRQEQQQQQQEEQFQQRETIPTPDDRPPSPSPSIVSSTPSLTVLPTSPHAASAASAALAFSPRADEEHERQQRERQREIAARIEEYRAKGFKIGEFGDWEEYLDRTTGDQYYINTLTGRFSETIPEADDDDDDGPPTAHADQVDLA